MSDVRVKGIDELPRYRARYGDTEACRWQEHYWLRFISVALNDGETILVLCERCGMTPLEGLALLPIYREATR